MLLISTLDVSVRSIPWHRQSLRFLRECRSPAHLIFQRGQSSTQSRFEVLQGMSLAGKLDVSVSSMLRRSQRLRFLRECRLPARLIFQWGQGFVIVKVWDSSGNITRRHTCYFNEVNASTQSKVEVPQRMSFTGKLDVSAKSMLWHSQGLRFLRECRLPAHLMFKWGQCFNTVKVWGSSGNIAHRHIWFFSEVNASTELKFEVPQGMLLAGILDASVSSMIWHSQGLRFFREFCSPAYLMFQLGQCFDTVKVWGSSGNVARRHTWCFSDVKASTRSMFEVPQGMLLAGILDASVSLMLWHSQSLRFLRECHSQTHLMFQRDQCLNTVKVWGSSRNVACRNTWCFR